MRPRILLINPSHGTHGKSSRAVPRFAPPMSILAVGTAYRNKGYDVDIIDTHIEDRWKWRIACMLDEYAYEFVGISVMVGKFMKNADEITDYIKVTWPHVKVVWGGIMVQAMREEMGEYLTQLDVRSFPLAFNWELLGDKCNRKQEPYYQMIMTSVGCPYRCSFCYSPNLEVKKVYYRDTADVCEELDYLNDRNGTTVFTVGDDNFLTKPSRALAILEHCKRKGYYLEEVIGHINGLSDELIEGLAGVASTFIFSIETASPRLLGLLNKDIKLDEVPGKLAKLRAKGIICNVSFMVGLPTEEQHDLTENMAYMELMKKANPYIRGNSYIWFPLPKTVLTEFAANHYKKSFTFNIREYEDANFWMGHDKGAYFRPHLTQEQYDDLITWGSWFNDYYRNPKPRYILDDVLNNNKPKLGVPID